MISGDFRFFVIFLSFFLSVLGGMLHFWMNHNGSDVKTSRTWEHRKTKCPNIENVFLEFEQLTPSHCRRTRPVDCHGNQAENPAENAGWYG